MQTHRFFTATLLAAALFIVPALASAAGIDVTGKVIDAATGLPLVGVKLQTIGPKIATATTDVAGRFTLPSLAPGLYSLQADLSGYETTISEEFSVQPGFTLPLTLSMQRTATTSQIRTLGRTTVTAAASLQKAAVIYQQVSGNTLKTQGMTRSGDAVRRIGAVENTSSDTATLGDDVTIAIRGIGDLETVSLVDGHPIAYGLNGGLNYEITPSFGLRAVNVVYGAGGGDLYGVDAIGGVVDMQTLEPTRTPQIIITQGYGTFDKLTSALTATGSLDGNRWGYALALGSSGSNGPGKNTFTVQPAAAFDISATVPAVTALSSYHINSNLVNRSQLYKLRYGFGNNTHLTAVALSSYWWDNKSGIGDNDYLPMDTALASGNKALASYTPPGNTPPFNALNPQDCGAGTFQGTGTGGNAYGYGTDGVTPDGGTTCVTPQQWANLNSGWQGAGAAWQGFTNTDYQVRLDSTIGRNTLNINGYSDLYTQTYDRTWQLPYLLSAPAASATGCTPSCTLVSQPFWRNSAANNTGVVGTYSMVGQDNELGVGAYYNNNSLRLSSVGVPLPSPSAYETSFFFRDAWHPITSPITTYVSAYFKHSTLTNSSFVDPRIAIVGDRTNDVYRASLGWISTVPYLNQVFSPFSPTASGAFTSNVACGTLNSVGGGGNPNAKPERASDTEFSWGHRFSGDSSFQFSLYSEPINNQLFTQTIPALAFPSSFFGPNGYGGLNAYVGAYQLHCGGTPADALTHLGVDAVTNIGKGLAEGIDLQGRQRVTREFFVDYGYTTNSSVPLDVPANILKGNLLLIPNAQLPFIPLHKANFALDYTFGKLVEARTETYFVAANNPKNLPAYNYTNLIVSVFTGQRGVLNIVTNNLFQQNSDYRGLIGEGYPHPLNQYATAADYTPLIGATASERFGLVFRTIEFIYQYKLH